MSSCSASSSQEVRDAQAGGTGSSASDASAVSALVGGGSWDSALNAVSSAVGSATAVAPLVSSNKKHLSSRARMRGVRPLRARLRHYQANDTAASGVLSSRISRLVLHQWQETRTFAIPSTTTPRRRSFTLSLPSLMTARGRWGGHWQWIAP